MLKRTKIQQSKHNVRVRKIAGGYKSQGWKVKADIRGYPSPKLISGRQPDVIATKGKKERIIEVETRDSMKKDSKQRDIFKRYANVNKKRKFKTSVV